MEEQKAPEKASKTKKGRSPAYPGISLEEALDRAETIRTAEGRNEASVDTILEHWSYRPMSGVGLVALSALIKFGLMTDSGSGKNRKAHLTDLAFKILLDDRPDSSERMALIKEAALVPSIHKELWEKYNGTLPSDSNLRFVLRNEMQFLDNAADELIKEFRKTIDFTKLGESGNISLGGEQIPSLGGDIDMTAIIKPPQVDQTGGKQTIRQIQIPLTNAPWGVIQLPVPMTEGNWKELEDMLNLMKGPITGTRKQSGDTEQTNQG